MDEKLKKYLNEFNEIIIFYNEIKYYYDNFHLH